MPCTTHVYRTGRVRSTWREGSYCVFGFATSAGGNTGPHLARLDSCHPLASSCTSFRSASPMRTWKAPRTSVASSTAIDTCASPSQLSPSAYTVLVGPSLPDKTHLFPFNRPFCPHRQTRTSPAACWTPLPRRASLVFPSPRRKGGRFPWERGSRCCGPTVSIDVVLVRLERDLRDVCLDCAHVVTTMSEDEAQASEGEEEVEEQDGGWEDEGREDPDATDDGNDPKGKRVAATSNPTSPPKVSDGGEREHVESQGKRTESRHRRGVDVFAIPALENIYSRSNVLTRDGRRVREACRKYLGTSTTARRGERTYRGFADRTISNARGNRCGIQTKNNPPGCCLPTTRGTGKNIPSA